MRSLIEFLQIWSNIALHSWNIGLRYVLHIHIHSYSTGVKSARAEEVLTDYYIIHRQIIVNGLLAVNIIFWFVI